MRRARSKTPTTPEQQTTEIGNLVLTEPTSRTSKKSLTEEAKEFKSQRVLNQPDTISPRIYLAGMAMSALIAAGAGRQGMDYIRRESYEWADYMLEET